MSEATASTTSVMRVMNERAAFAQLLRHGPASRPELAAATGLSKPTIAVALADLERVGLIQAIGRRSGGAGRSAQVYTVHPTAGWALAIDVGRGFVRVALANLVGEIVVRRDERSQARSASALITQAESLVADVAAAADISPVDITYTVFGTPGIHDEQTGALVLAPNLPGWNHTGAVERLRKVTPSPFIVENDINLAALGEQARGLGAGVRNFVFLSIGTGIGMGVVIDGCLYRGSQRAAGEISYLPFGETDPLAAQPGSRRRGLLESVASADGMVEAARRRGMTGRLTAKRILEAARDGDETALAVVAKEADYLAHALASVIAVLDPELIVLGGGIGAHGSALLTEPVRERLHDLVVLRPPRIEVSALGDDAVVLGALATGLDRARDLLFDRAVAAQLPSP
ncbi:MAG TPA: ROK family protein [Acidimicrobiales bacterium]